MEYFVPAKIIQMHMYQLLMAAPSFAIQLKGTLYARLVKWIMVVNLNLCACHVQKITEVNFALVSRRVPNTAKIMKFFVSTA